jgi:hypothetical protein
MYNVQFTIQMLLVEHLFCKQIKNSIILINEIFLTQGPGGQSSDSVRY